jgi:ribose 5-phosphate isomerase B
MKEIVTVQDVQAVPPGGELSAGAGAIVTPWAQEVAATRGVRIVLGPVAQAALTVAVGADHGGFALKEQVKSHLTRLGHRFRDLGTFSTDPVDYPDVALAVAKAVRAGDARFGIVVDGAGIGSAMAANKVPGVRAALCSDAAAARNAREHNDANVFHSARSSWMPGACARSSRHS